MGIFNYVRYSAPCPMCGEILTDWQTKDGDTSMVEVLASEVSNFYTNCKKCKTWVDAKVVPTEYTVVLSTEKKY